jgi:hypothetical protein
MVRSLITILEKAENHCYVAFFSSFMAHAHERSLTDLVLSALFMYRTYVIIWVVDCKFYKKDFFRSTMSPSAWWISTLKMEAVFSFETYICSIIHYNNTV